MTQTVTVTDNQAPVIAATEPVTANTDAGACSARVEISAPEASDNCAVGTPTGTRSDNLALDAAYPVGTTTITWNVTDANGNAAAAVTQTVTVTDNQAPTIACVSNQTRANNPGTCSYTVIGNEFDPTSSDNCSVASITNDYNNSSTLAGAVFNEGTTTVTWTVVDAAGNTSRCSFTVTVNNTAPAITSISGPEGPVQVGADVHLSATFTDNNLASATWRLMANGTTVSEYTCTNCISGNNITGTFKPTPGVYTVELEVNDRCGATTRLLYEYVVVYDPNGGFVTGGGWIESPAGAMLGDKSGVKGRANFGFNAKYKTGKNNTTEVDGHTNFQFRDGDLHFSSIEHEDMSLVISGKKATYTGWGTVNGKGRHRFRVIAIDGDVNGGGPDEFRIKIWGDNSNSDVLYDNQRGVSESSDLATVLGGGSIVIHKPAANGKSTTTSSKLIAETTVEPEIAKFYNYPNMFTDKTTIVFSLDKSESYLLEVFDIRGVLIKKVDMGVAEAGKLYEFGFDGSNLSKGMYIGRLTTPSGSKSIKMILNK
ncbi:HYR domain-containing protein [Pontibacter burrus]|uniref:HYR domain-containing protein n=1 Tax=Pontibacter burrus TaxID=2704466 RepID=A0A6B3LZ14_9BACT|nr:T9SS type A sorting domain-containing protein [Pontibacter burrus]NEM98714.1 HYR domain-containing protein [Pontibacter burrus]